jgi:hypothetical protein
MECCRIVLKKRTETAIGKKKTKKRSRSSSLFSKTLGNLPNLGSIKDKHQIQFGKSNYLPNPQKQEKKTFVDGERNPDRFSLLFSLTFAPKFTNSNLPRLPARCVDSTPATFRNPVNKTSQRARAGASESARGEDAASFPPASVQTPFAFALYPSVHYQPY